MTGATGLADLARAAREAIRGDERAVLARVVSVEGSHYRRAGARMVLAEDGASAGSISGGCLEADLARRIPEICAKGRVEEIVYDMTSPDDVVWGLGLGCNGRVRVAVTPVTEALARQLEVAAARHAEGLPARLDGEEPEGIAAPPLLLVCGAGRDAEPLVRLAQSLGWRVTIAAPRLSDAARRRFAGSPGAAFVSEGGLPSAATGPRTTAVVMTHNFLDDLALLERLGAVGRPLAYLGILGPRERTRRLLAAMGDARAQLPARIHSPAGLDIGAETPEEIALSILAEIQAVLTEGSGGFLDESRIRERALKAGA